MVIWAANNVVAKLIVREASPLLVALVRFTLAGLFFHLPVFLFLHRGEQRLNRDDAVRVVLLGAVGVAGSLVLSLMALRTTPATDVAADVAGGTNAVTFEAAAVGTLATFSIKCDTSLTITAAHVKWRVRPIMGTSSAPTLALP